MKVVSNEALTKLIQLIKSSFIKVDDIVQTQEVTLADVAISGDYDDLINKPTIPTVNDATLTIQKNGSNVATFTANASSNVTANIEVPTVDQTYSASSTNAQSGVAVASAISTKADSSTVSDINSRVTTIESEIPAQASSSNQLADKNFVNSSIATNTANFIGTFNSVAELEAYSGQKDDNDYAFVVSTDAAGNTVYNRYKWNGSAWLFEYALNNSSFTANQWAAINSGATTANIGQIATNTTAIAGKQDIISDLAAIRSGAAAGATAVQPADLDTLLSSLYPVGSIYIGTQSTCPLATLISGSTWVKVSEGRVLQGSDSSHSAGTTIEAGLPNITGEPVHCYLFTNSGGSDTPISSGAIVIKDISSTTLYQGGTTQRAKWYFDASRSSSIYGNSNTVQPPAFVVNIWQRTA
jgi:hypothetical protein